MSRMNFDTLEEAQAYMEATMNEPFKPQGKKQQAQAIAYDAYETEDEEERIELAAKAYALDRENVDAILLQAEMADSEKEAERLYQVAIHIGEAQFDDEPEIPWGLVTNRPYMRALFAYGIWLFEEERYADAVKYFMQLLKMNPEDHQDAGILALASLIHNGDYGKAEFLSEQLEEYEVESVSYLYLKWVLAKMTMGSSSQEVAKLFEEAMDANPYVDGFYHDDAPKVLYPRREEITPGSFDEALYIWSLL